jgi:hypothetical protein
VQADVRRAEALRPIITITRLEGGSGGIVTPNSIARTARRAAEAGGP